MFSGVRIHCRMSWHSSEVTSAMESDMTVASRRLTKTSRRMTP